MEKSQSTHVQLELIKKKKYVKQSKSYWTEVKAIYGIDPTWITQQLFYQSFSGKCIELDFSKNLALKPKYEVQDAHFSGKQYSLHCSSVEPGDNECVYCLSDDTNHEPVFVNEVLEDIFEHWNIKDETIIIKSDNAPTQYKNKFAFQSMINLSNKYNIRIIRINGAAGHGKGLIDAVSSFGVKAILRRDIVSHDCWLESNNDICEYL